jgi:hypothetical protein
MRVLRIALMLGFIGLVGPSVDAGVVRCKLATKGDSEVAKACKEGGVAKARGLMKEMVKKAKSTMDGLECKTCHEGNDEYYDVLKKDGRVEFDKMLAVLKK